jgi:hypothetical protein
MALGGILQRNLCLSRAFRSSLQPSDFLVAAYPARWAGLGYGRTFGAKQRQGQKRSGDSLLTIPAGFAARNGYVGWGGL